MWFSLCSFDALEPVRVLPQTPVVTEEQIDPPWKGGQGTVESGVIP